MAPLIPLCLEQSTHLYVLFLLFSLAIPTNITFWKCFCILYSCKTERTSVGFKLADTRAGGLVAPLPCTAYFSKLAILFDINIMIMQHATVDTIKSNKTGTSLQDYGIIELWQKYSSTVHACSVTTQSLLLQVKDHQSKQRLSAESACN